MKKNPEKPKKDVTYLYSSSRWTLHSLRHFFVSSIIFLWCKVKCCLPRIFSISYSNIEGKKKHHQSSEHNVIFLKIPNWLLNLLLLILNVRVERRICLYISGSELQPMGKVSDISTQFICRFICKQANSIFRPGLLMSFGNSNKITLKYLVN